MERNSHRMIMHLPQEIKTLERIQVNPASFASAVGNDQASSSFLTRSTTAGALTSFLCVMISPRLDPSKDRAFFVLLKDTNTNTASTSSKARPSWTARVHGLLILSDPDVEPPAPDFGQQLHHPLKLPAYLIFQEVL